jgi:hypothetical protein
VALAAAPAADVSKAPRQQSTQLQQPVPNLKAVNEMLQCPGIVFIENRGQFDSRAKFLVKGGGANLWLTNEGIVFDFQQPVAKQDSAATAEKRPTGANFPLDPKHFDPRMKSDPPAMQRMVFTQKLVGASPNPTIEALDPQPGIYNYFIGKDPDKWRTHVVAYKEVVYRDVWKGVDLRLFANGVNLEEEFIVHPGADAGAVQLAYEGIQDLAVGDDGSLKVATAFGDIAETSPRIYQESAGKETQVSGNFKVTGNAYTFEVAQRDEHADLIIDPTVIYLNPQHRRKSQAGTLLYSTFLGGSGGIVCCDGPTEYATAVAVDTVGNAYVTGVTGSSDFPITPGAFQTQGQDPCAFVTKFGPLGDALRYSTYLCGVRPASAYGIAVDAAGDAYITGLGQADFPTTPNALQQAVNGAFVTKMNAAGDSLLYSTGFGTASTGRSIAVDSSGRAYFAGNVQGGYSIPTTANAFQSSYFNKSPGVAFVGVLDPSQSGQASLVYGSYLGGSGGGEVGKGIAVDAYGMCYVTGDTSSLDFPVTPGAFQTMDAGGERDTFVTKFNPYASSGPASVLYSTYLGGGGDDRAHSVAVDSMGDAIVSGETDSGKSPSAPFPTTPGALFPNWDPAWGDSSGYVTKLNAAGNKLVFSTYWGGAGSVIAGIATDLFANEYVAGYSAGLLLVTGDAFQSQYLGGNLYGYGNADGLVSKFDSSGNLVYSSYLGGTGYEQALGIATDSAGDAYVAGWTMSVDFPTTPFAFQPQINPGGLAADDAFLTKLPLGTGAISISGILPNAGGNAGQVTPEVLGTGFHLGATAQLNCGGNQVPGKNVTVSAEGRILSATFDLTASSPATCDVAVTNPDHTSAKLANGFTIVQGGAPQLWLQLYAPPRINSFGGMLTAYFGNAGLVNAHDAVLTLIVPSNLTLEISCPLPTPNDLGLSWEPPPEWCDLPMVVQDSEGNSIVNLWILDLPSGVFGSLDVTLVPRDYEEHKKVHAMHAELGSAPDSDFSRTGDPTVVRTSFVAQTLADALVSVLNGQFSRGQGYSRGQILNATTDVLIRYDKWKTSFGHGHPVWDVILGQVIGYVLDRLHIPYNLIGGDLDTALRLLARGAFWVKLHNKQLEDAYTEYNSSNDPNDLVGPTGAGALMWVGGSQQLDWGILFSNDPGASAPAQRVVVTNPIDPHLDWSTTKLTTINIPNIQVPIPSTFNPAAGLYDAQMSVDLRPSQDLFVNIDANLNPSTRVLTWTFQSIDPKTGMAPTDPNIGFLHPGDTGSVFWGVTPKPSLATGTQVSDQGEVVFDALPAEMTVVWTNALDNTLPTSQVSALPPTESCADFKVAWSGNDVGSGVQNFTVYVSDNGGTFAPWLTNTTLSSSVYQGQVGHTYGFYSIAMDLVGNVEPGKNTAEATTQVTSNYYCGPPSLSGTASVASYSQGVLSLNLQLNDVGTADALKVMINQIAFHTQKGSGDVTLASPTLPISVGKIPVDQSKPVALTLNVPSTVKKFSITEEGKMHDSAGNHYHYSIKQVVVP